jgi:hypothetical protein
MVGFSLLVRCRVGFSTRSRGFGSIVGLTVALAAWGAGACAGKSDAAKGGAGGGGTSGSAGKGAGGASGGSSGKGAGGASGGTGGTAGRGGTAGATGGSAGGGQGGSTAGTGGTAGNGAAAGEGGEGGEMPADPPVLERPVREEYACSVTTPITNRGLEWSAGEVTSTSSGAFLLWGRPAANGMEDGIMLASLDDTGGVGMNEEIATYSGAYSSRPRVAATSSGMTASWVEAGANEMSVMQTAALDATGAVTRMPTVVTGPSERLGDPTPAATADGTALLYVQTDVDYTESVLRLALLDGDGVPLATPVDVLTFQDVEMGGAGALVAIPGGFALTFSTWLFDPESWLLFLDENGARRGAAIKLGDGGYGVSGQDLFVRGNELIVAYASHTGSYDDSDIAGFIGLARFDLTTRQRTAPDVRVQTPTLGDETVGPVLFDVDGDLGLLWSRGTVIYVCAGCMPDNHLEAVVMDGDDFTPLTELLTFQNDEPMGGYVRPGVARAGDRFVVATDLRFHVSGVVATGAFACNPTP